MSMDSQSIGLLYQKSVCFYIKMADDFKDLSWDRKMEHDKSSVCCKIDHVLHIVKNQMGYAKAAYCGIEKNMNLFHVLFASANLLMCNRVGRTQGFVGGMV